MKQAIERLLFPEPTSFHNVDKWTMLDFGALLRFSPTLERLEEDQFLKFGRSFVADAFFALSRETANWQDVLGLEWAKMMNDSAFPKMPESMQDRVSLVLTLSKLVEQAVFEHREEIKEAQEEDQTEEEQDGEGVAGDEDGDIMDIGIAMKAKDQAETLSELVGVMGDGAGLDASTPSQQYEKALALANQFDLDLFANILGWAQMYAGGAAREDHQGQGRLVGYEFLEWSDNVEVDEMIAVSKGDITALASLAEGTMTTVKYISINPKGRGAAIVLRDESDSMNKPAGKGYGYRYSKHNVALTMEIALAVVMNRQKRDLVSMGWSSKVKKYDDTRMSKVQPAVRTHIYGEPGVETHIRKFLGGGTSIEPAVEEAALTAMEWEDPCDILLVSDMEFFGEGWEVSEKCNAILQEYREAGGRVWGIFVGPDAPGDSWVQWLDGWMHSTSLKADEESGKIIAAMVKNPAKEGAVVML